MELFECIDKRASIREYDRKDVPNELLAQILTAGTHAPSAGNTQEWEFIIVRELKTKKQLSQIALNQSQVEKAPVIIAVLVNLDKISLKYKQRGKELYSIQDTSACIQNILLASTALGLGTCWIGSFDEERAKSILAIPDKFRIVAMITVGFPVPYGKSYKPERIPFENLTWEEKHGKELSWIMPYNRKSRFHWKPLDKQIEEMSERVKELKAKSKEVPHEKLKESKKQGKPFSEKFADVIKNLTKKKI